MTWIIINKEICINIDMLKWVKIKDDKIELCSTKSGYADWKFNKNLMRSSEFDKLKSLLLRKGYDFIVPSNVSIQ